MERLTVDRFEELERPEWLSLSYLRENGWYPISNGDNGGIENTLIGDFRRRDYGSNVEPGDYVVYLMNEVDSEEGWIEKLTSDVIEQIRGKKDKRPYGIIVSTHGQITLG